MFWIFLISFAQANWMTFPDDGKTYSRESACPGRCYQIPAGTDKRDLDLSGDTLVENATKKTNRENQEAADKASRDTATARLEELEAKSNLTPVERDEVLKILLGDKIREQKQIRGVSE